MRVVEKKFIIAGFILAILLPSKVFATDYTSGSFDSRDPVINNYGGNSTSSSFQQTSSGGENPTGESTSSNFMLRSGFLYFDVFNPRSQNWRWYSDVNNETPSTALAAENTAPSTVNPNDNLKLRLTIKETSNVGNLNTKYKLQFSTASDFSSGVTDVAEIGGTCTTSSQWCYTTGTGSSDNAVITTKVLSDADSCSGSVGQGCGTHNTSGSSSSTFNHKKSAATEFEFILTDSNAMRNTTFFFRAFDTGNNRAVSTNTGANYPSLSTQATQVTFTIAGLSSGTNTGGITTDVSAAGDGTAVAFGSLNFNSQTHAAQRLHVTTDATGGYQVFVFQQQGLVSPHSDEILPVSGTNASPTAWGSGCTTNPGCYGYHSTDGTLIGGSTRFAANDTYAQFDSTAREVAYNSGAVNDEQTDIILDTYVTRTQAPGAYSSSIIYIVVPTF